MMGAKALVILENYLRDRGIFLNKFLYMFFEPASIIEQVMMQSSLGMKFQSYKIGRKGNCCYEMYLRFTDDNIPYGSSQAIYWVRNALADWIAKNAEFFGDYFITGKFVVCVGEIINEQ